MERNYLKIPGIVSVVIGFFLLLGSSAGITGFVVGGETEQTFGYYVGTVFVILGFLLLAGGYRIYRHQVRSRESLRFHDKEARWAAAQDYKQKYGRNPINTELRDYARKLHDSGEISEVVMERRKRGRAA